MSAEPKLSLADSSELFEAANAFADAVVARLKSLLGEDVEIRHIGATAVPGCLTKGDVDIVVRADTANFAGTRERLDAHYEKNLGSPRDESFASYTDGTQRFPLGIQLVLRGSKHDNFHQFTERLRQSGKLLAAYNALKRDYAGADMETYRAAKAEFIARALAAGQIYRLIGRLDESHVEDLVALYQNEWWSKRRTRDDVRKMLAHSDLVFGLVEAETCRLVGFARVLTDRVYRGTLYDVIVAGDKRGSDLGKRLMDAVTAHPDLAGIEQLELHCLPELEPFYARWGFAQNTTGTSTLRRRRAG
jgi:GrpB-like predicted nucleotidyltransferase (UPF0157 family)